MTHQIAKTLFAILMTSYFMAPVLGQCLDRIYLEQAEVTTYHKRSSRTNLPALDWRNIIINRGLGSSINDPLDFGKYELMLHAAHSKKGLMIWRICQNLTRFRSRTNFLG